MWSDGRSGYVIRKLSHFSILNCRPAFQHTFETCSLKVISLSILFPNNLTESLFSNVVLCSVKVGSGSSLFFVIIHHEI